MPRTAHFYGWALAAALLSARLALAGSAPQTLAGGASCSFAVAVAEGHPLLVEVDQDGIDVVVAATAPDGRALPAVDSPNGRRGPEYLVLHPEPPGVYQVEVRSPSRTAPPGRFRFATRDLAGETADARERLAAFSHLAAAAAHYRLGTAAERRQAIADLTAALPAWRALRQPRDEAETLAFLAAAHASLGEPATAHATFLAAAAAWDAIAAGTDPPPGGAAGSPALRAADALLGAGLASWQLGQNADAAALFGRALARFQASGDRASEAAAHNNLCLLSLSAGDLAAALPCFEQAVAAFAALADGGREATARNNLGGVYEEQGEPLAARAQHTLSLTLARQAGDPRGESLALNNLAGVDAGLGDADAALAAYEQALALFHQAGDRGREASARNNLGWLYLGLGDAERARTYLEAARDLRREVGDRRGEAATLNNLGLAWAQLHDLPRAVETYQQAYDIATRLADPGTEATALELLGRARLAEGDAAAAGKLLAQALPLAQAMGDRGREAQILARQGEALAAAGDAAAARRCLDRALALQRATLDAPHEAETLATLARLEHRLGRDDDAQERVDEALPLVESLRRRVPGPDLRAAFLAAQQDVYEVAVDLLMSREARRPGDGAAAAAFAMSERARTRSLLDRLSEAAAQVRQGVDPELLRREREVLARLGAKALRRTGALAAAGASPTAGAAASSAAARSPADDTAARAELEALRAEADRVAAEIRRQSPRYAALTRPAPLTAAAIQERLAPDDSVLLEVALGESRSFLFRVDRATLASYELPGRAALESRAEELYRRLQSPAPDAAGGAAVTALLADLGRMLLGPLPPGALGERRLVVVADGALQLIPWATLPDPDAAGVPLLVHHEMVALPSAAMLAAERDAAAGRTPAPKTLAILADPVFDARDSRLPPGAATAEIAATATGLAVSPEPRAGWSRLPATRREADAVAALVPPGELLRAVDFAASRATAQAPELAQYRIVHFATHGVLDAHAPELSGLVLSLVGADGRPRDGFLSLGDIYNLRLGADLVVLSGCETALGKPVRGEGLLGLTQGFFYAGARRIVASLWQVEDVSTAELMTRFYRGILAQGLAPAAALRQAQLAVRADPRWRSPYHWAAFILEGDWR